MRILTNHMGYSSKDFKKAVFQGEESIKVFKFSVMNMESNRSVYEGKPEAVGEVASWQKGYFWVLDFSKVQEEGSYRISLDTDRGIINSYPFEIKEYLLPLKMISSVCYYFKAQRNTGEWLSQDKALTFRGDREGVVDVHGGWFDATGDYCIHLSHLSHSSYFNPQQASFTAYNFFKLYELLEATQNEQYSIVKRRILDEGMWGADFMMRMHAPSGSFFRSINREGAFDLIGDARQVGFEYHESSTQFGEAVTAKEEQIIDAHYETAFRSGGGFAIATLAAAGRYYYPGTDFKSHEYIQIAKNAYAHLETCNERYTNDGKWNLIDEYSALEALVELYKTTKEYGYLLKAREMSKCIMMRTREEESGAYFVVDEEIRFYHAADEGLPVVALMDYYAVEMDEISKKEVLEVCSKVMRYALDLTYKGNNPFGYAKYKFVDHEGIARERFFFSHHSNAAPWWQGDNARLASLACAARTVACKVQDGHFKEELLRYAEDQTNWIMGLNPYDSCMIEGYGRNNITYFFNGRYDFVNCPGGICNGITSGSEDEEGIEFVLKPTEEINDNWRWAEQWLPHATWFIRSMAMKAINEL